MSPLGGGKDDYTNIQNAINSCPAGEVVQLAAGAFSVNTADLPILISSGISLRGTGTCNGTSSPYCQTSITVADGMLPYTGGKCGTSTSAEVTCPNGGPAEIEIMPVHPDYNWGWMGCGNAGGFIGTGCGAVPLAADAAQGQTTIQVTTTSGFTVGSWVLIDEASGAGWITDPMNSFTGYGSVWAAPDWQNASSGPATGRVSWPKASNGNWDFDTSSYPYQANSQGCWFSYCDRPTAELHLVTAIGSGPCPGTNCTITFDDPLTIAFRVSGGTTFVGSITSGSTKLTVVSGTPVIGQLVAGTGIPQGDYIVSGSGTSYTLSIAATATQTSETMTSGSHEAQVYPAVYPNHDGSGSPVSFLTYAGVENLSLARAPNGGIMMQLCAYCWVKNVDIYYWYNGGINIDYSVRSELNTVYVHHCANSVNSGGEYPIDIVAASTEILVTNSITNFAGKGMTVRAAGAGSVISYNYIDDSMYDSYSGIGDYWIDSGLNASHYSGPHHVLFEGNWADNMDNDNTHGNSMYITFFRNESTGMRTPFKDPSLPSSYQTVDDFTGVGYSCGGTGPSSCVLQMPGPLRAAGPMSYNYWFAFIGNVLGLSGKTTSANGWSYEGDWNGNRMFMLGWNAQAGGQDPYIDGATASYISIDGNYDYVNGSVTWASSDTQHTLPNSLYLTSAPAFFSAGASCTYSWPWVTPTGSSQLPSNSCSGSGLPALARWNAGTPFIQP